MIIEFKNVGKTLGTRALGEEVRQQIVAGLRAGEKITFDFADVDVVSNSFADETLAKLVLEFEMPFIKQHTTFKNTNPFVQLVIAFAFNQRLAQLHH